MDIHEATKQYELWLATHLELVESDLKLKHERMAEKAFPFLRATYYRWSQVWQTLCPQLASATAVLSVGDIHIENFGTWRDTDGRLIWGVNDFDEAYPLPYTSDLLRLATSALVAIDEDHLSVGRGKACDAIVQGYKHALECGGRPFVLAEHHNWLRKIGLSHQRRPEVFWRKLGELETWQGTLPAAATSALTALLPGPTPFRVVHRTAGLGTLGRQRWVAIADWWGGKLAREVKPLAPSVNTLAEQKAAPSDSYYLRLLEGAVHVADPFVKVVDIYPHSILNRDRSEYV